MATRPCLSSAALQLLNFSASAPFDKPESQNSSECKRIGQGKEPRGSKKPTGGRTPNSFSYPILREDDFANLLDGPKAEAVDNLYYKIVI